MIVFTSLPYERETVIVCLPAGMPHLACAGGTGENERFEKDLILLVVVV